MILIEVMKDNIKKNSLIRSLNRKTKKIAIVVKRQVCKVQATIHKTVAQFQLVPNFIIGVFGCNAYKINFRHAL